jgi:hypothetical protein
MTNEICALLGYYAALSGTFLPTFRGLIGPILEGQEVHGEKSDSCPETSVKKYPSTLRDIPEERRSHVPRGGNLKSRTKTEAP